MANQENLFSGQLPKHLVISMVENTPNFTDKQCTWSYASLFTGTGFMGYDRGNQISLEEYSKGFTFDLTPDLDKGSHFHLVKQGNLRLELHFKTGLPQTINVIVYAEFDVIEID